MFDKVKKGYEMKRIAEKFQDDNVLDIRAIEEFIQKGFRNCDDCDLDSENFCDDHVDEIKDFSIIADWLNQLLEDQEFILEAAGVDFTPARKFDMDEIRRLFASKDWGVAVDAINQKFAEQDKRLKRQICKALDVSEDDIDEMF
jgi:hypothetical protein